MTTKKDRRGSGRSEARITIPARLALEEFIEPVVFWDDWTDYRDGFRPGRYSEEKLVRPQKVAKHKQIRSARGIRQSQS